MWNLVAHQIVEAGDYDLLETARLFALLNLTLADANRRVSGHECFLGMCPVATPHGS
jgi:hypothetical protein